MQFFTTPTSYANYSGTLGVAIYSNTGSYAGSPNTLIGYGTLYFPNDNVDKKFHDVTFQSPVNLTANAFYWAAVAADNDKHEYLYSGFHNDYNGAYDIVKFQTSGFTTSGGFPATASSLKDGEYAFWFRIFNPDAEVRVGEVSLAEFRALLARVEALERNSGEEPVEDKNMKI